MSVNIRDASPDDAPEVARIYNFHVAAGGATFDVVPWSNLAVRRHLDHSTAVQPQEASRICDGWFVAATPAKLVGWASARRFSERFGYRHACETAIYLDEEAIGTGVADRLQQRIDLHCRERGIHHAVAKIIADNARSVRFHHKHGFTTVGVQEEIGRLNGRWIDVVILQKKFEIQLDESP